MVGFNLVGAADFIADYAHAIQGGLPEHAGALGAAYAIPILYVPLLMITHGVALYGLARGWPKGAGAEAAIQAGAPTPPRSASSRPPRPVP